MRSTLHFSKASGSTVWLVKEYVFVTIPDTIVRIWAKHTPGLIPIKLLIVHQDPLQLGDAKGRMRVIQLNRDCAG